MGQLLFVAAARRPYYGAGCAASLGQWRQQPFAQWPMRSSTKEKSTPVLPRAWPSDLPDAGTRRRAYYEAGCLAGLGQWRHPPFAQRAEAVEHGGQRYLRADTSLAVGPSRRRRPYYEAGCLAGLGQWRQRPFAQKAEAVEHRGRRYLRAHTSMAVGPSRRRRAAPTVNGCQPRLSFGRRPAQIRG